MTESKWRLRRRDAGRLILEGVVVILSILIAFMLDAWSDRRTLQRELNQELASVARELEENRGFVVYEIRALERVIAGSEALIEQLRGQSARSLVPVPDTLAFLVAFWSPTLEASFGAVDALIASGRLSQVGNADLRLGLAGLKARFGDPVADELQAQIIQNEQLYPLVSRHADFSGVYLLDQKFFAAERQLDRKVPTAQEVMPFPTSLEVRNAILNKASWLGSGLGELKVVLAQIDSLLALIRQETAR